MRISMKQAGHGFIPSPNMPTLSTAIVSPACVFSKGRIFPRAGERRCRFKFAGAPFIDGFAWKDQTSKRA